MQKVFVYNKKIGQEKYKVYEISSSSYFKQTFLHSFKIKEFLHIVSCQKNAILLGVNAK